MINFQTRARNCPVSGPTFWAIPKSFVLCDRKYYYLPDTCPKIGGGGGGGDTLCPKIFRSWKFWNAFISLCKTYWTLAMVVSIAMWYPNWDLSPWILFWSWRSEESWKFVLTGWKQKPTFQQWQDNQEQLRRMQLYTMQPSPSTDTVATVSQVWPGQSQWLLYNPVPPDSFTWIYILFQIGHFGDFYEFFKYWCLNKHNGWYVTGICLIWMSNVALSLVCTY